MKEFLKKFFGYFRYFDSDGALGIPEPYKDELGKGAFSDWRHFFWIILVIIICVILYKIYKKNQKSGKLTILVLSGALFTIRFTNQIVRAIVGAEAPAWRAFPFHMCTAMTFILPLVVLCNWKRLKTPIYTLSMMGGIITIIIGDYFDSRFMTFSTIEGMWAHTILVLVPIIEIAIGNFKFEFKKSWSMFIVMGLLLLWATLANNVFFKDYDTNYMYLRKNGLPGNIGGDYYFFVYALIFVVLFTFIYGSPTLYRIRKNKF